MKDESGFELFFRGRLLAAQSVRHDGARAGCHEFFWRRFEGGQDTAAHCVQEGAVLEVDGQGRPAYYELFSASSPFRCARFMPGWVEVTLADGSSRSLACDAPVDFVFQNNLIVQLALGLRLAPARAGGTYQFFSPETLRLGQIVAKPTAGGWSTNLGFCLAVDADGCPTGVYREGEEADKGADARSLRGAVAAVDWPAGMPQAARGMPRVPPTRTAAGGPVTEHLIDGPLGPLHATLWSPAGRVRAACLFLQGSGAIDRFGWAAGSDLGSAGLFDALAAQDTAVLSVDSRGAGDTAFVPEGANTYDARLDDALLACRWLTNRFGPGVPLVLVGHSLGALVSLLLVARHGVVPAALVLLAPAGRPLWRVVVRQVLEQGRRAQAPMSREARKRFGEALRGYLARRAPGEGNGAAGRDPPGAPWGLGELMGSRLGLVDPRGLLAECPCPLLLCYGAADTQVPYGTEGRALQAALERAGLQPQLRIFDGLNHLLRNGTSFDPMAAAAVARWTTQALAC